ncbi:glycosyltransferase family 4 protein [candidate division KSB1 bacterium]|nr:glycosyltransferase family 4 protein [candidate division KSB1 bacterium]NIR68854.1 glycosyltransferase family 4 protein [candidate division KSB1 bacterium]NIS27222.1 glycosyltransferase family 4 protein [candidate division KSB1 bacterium]NIT74107.1 glycosyltransferase family 4 protein [candidate division KSB1 bacterium]NIU27956.1 glycosyltransferase family 4 protein [candidate division KSB1 bacterium]
MPRILMVTMSRYPNDPRIRREAETLERNGLSVDIICLRAAGEKNVERMGKITVYRRFRESDKESILRYFWQSTIYMVWTFFLTQKLYFRQRYDLIQIHNMPDHLIFVGIIQKLLGVPIILDLHDLTVELFESKWNDAGPNLLRCLVRFGESISCKFADHLITTSMGFKNKLIERGVDPNKITLVLNSADEHIFQNASDRRFRKIEEGAKLLYHGTVAGRFGLEVAIDAVARLQDVIPNTTLYVYGKYDPSYRRQLEARIAKLNLSHRIVFGDWLSLEEVSQAINQADMGIVPYESDAFMNLALSTKTFEYVAMQLPVVAARLPSLKVIFDENCMRYFEPGNVQDFVDSIVQFCLNPELRQNCVQCASEAYKSISWPIMAKRYVNLISAHSTGRNGKN